MLTLLLCSLLAASAAPPEEAVKAVLDTQVAAWNRGDIPAFLTGYMNSPDITFLGRAGVTRGYQGLLERYRRQYPTPASMGTLRFSELEVQMLSPGLALVLGKFELTRSAAGGGDASGRFTLVFRLTGAGWKIIHDHTS